MKLSVCTYAMNRIRDVEKTIPHLLKTLLSTDELVFVDYSDQQYSSKWIQENIKDSRVVLIEVPNMDVWHMNHARNCAAVNASGDIFIFHDIDILVPERMFSTIREMPQGVWYGIGVGRNISGFAAIHKKDFYKVCGYEEALVGYGYDDTNMHIRLRDAGINRIDLDSNGVVAFYGDDQSRIMEKEQVGVWEINKEITEVLRKRHPFRNNVNRNWAKGFIRISK